MPPIDLDVDQWILERVGYVLDADGRLGSGIHVVLPDGRTGLLTARHVLVPAVLSGEVSVLPYSRTGCNSIEPISIRICARADCALLVLPATTPTPRLGPNEWDPRTRQKPQIGDSVTLVGAPADWKSPPDPTHRSIETIRTLLYSTRVQAMPSPGFIECGVDETDKDIPRSFHGMSGGPVFDTNHRLIGINTSEIRGNTIGAICATLRGEWSDLLQSEIPYNELPKDFCGVPAKASVSVTMSTPAKGELNLTASLQADLFWSQSTPDHPYGEFGTSTRALASRTARNAAVRLSRNRPSKLSRMY